MNLITTNLRMDFTDYQWLKHAAVDARMSVNEYLNTLVKDIRVGKALGVTVKKQKETLAKALLELASEPYERRPMGLSALDEEIYSI